MKTAAIHGLESNHIRDKSTHEPTGFAEALVLFKKAAERIPAYRDFLQSHNIDPHTIQTWDDWQTLPIMTKDNYLRHYPLHQLVWDGELTSARIISMSSGSTGEPFNWPRGLKSVNDAVKILDDLFARVYQTKEKRTLCINAYAMGTWIAGTYMLSAIAALADKGHKIVSVTPGINHQEIVGIITRLGKEFDQILVMGYAPFLKDTVELAIKQGVRLADYHITFLFSSEHITEKWRRYVLDRVEPGYDATKSLCLYGAADMGIIGMESPLIIYIRDLIEKDEQLAKRLFPGTSVLPTIVTYDPTIRFTETVDHHFIFTLDSSLPLIRYDLMDEGRILSHQELLSVVRERGYQTPDSLLAWADQPLLALYGRADVAAMFYGLNIYPENIKSALEIPALLSVLTGKFTVSTEFNEQQEQSLRVVVELKEGIQATLELKDQVLEALRNSLISHNNEYSRLWHELGQRAEPVIELVSYGRPEFQINRKHRWVAK